MGKQIREVNSGRDRSGPRRISSGSAPLKEDRIDKIRPPILAQLVELKDEISLLKNSEERIELINACKKLMELATGNEVEVKRIDELSAKVYKKLAGETYFDFYQQAITGHISPELHKLAITFYTEFNKMVQINQNEQNPRDVHDLRNLINIIKLSTEKIEKTGVLDGRTKQKVITAAKIASKILLEDYEAENLKINEVAQEICSFMEGEVESNFTFERNFKTVKSTINASYLQIIRIFQNLIRNALDALKPDPDMIAQLLSSTFDLSMLKEKKITLEISEEQDHISIICHDNGIKISTEVLNSMQAILASPYNGELFSTKNFGTGHGLRIIATHVQKCSGTVSVENDENGTTFVVKLPKTEFGN